MEGFTRTADGDREAMRTMPMTAFAAVRYTAPNGTLWVEPFIKTAAREDRLSASDRSDTQRIPPRGTPGYTVCHIRAGYKVSPTLELMATVENIFNTDYRIHGSGNNEAGRNFILSALCQF